MYGLIVLGVIFIIFIVVIIVNAKIVPQANAYVVERLGAYHATWETGFQFSAIAHFGIKIVHFFWLKHRRHLA